MNAEQKQALRWLRQTIALAYQSNLFDELPIYIHPDIINEFVDGVRNADHAENGDSGV